MITDKHEIEIELINNIKSINISDLSRGNDEADGRMSITVVYDDNKKISYNYRSKYFPKLLEKIIEVYNNSNNKEEIYLFGDNTKEIIERLSRAYLKNNTVRDIPFAQVHPIIEQSSNKFNVKIIESLFKDILKSLIYLDTDTTNYEFIGLKGNKNNFALLYNSNDVEKIIPLTITKEGSNYIFKTSFINDIIFDINGTINFYKDAIISKWFDNKSGIEGEVVYSKNPIDEHNVIKLNDNIIGVEKNKDKEITEQEVNIIKKLCQMYNIYIDDCNKSNGTIFINEHKTENNNIKSIQNTNIIINEDTINIKLKTKRDVELINNCSIFIEDDNIDITLSELNIDDRKFILEQINYLPTRSTGDYKYFLQNKYTYKLYEINKNDKLNENFEIINEIEINEYIKDINDIKNIIKDKGDKTYGFI